MMLWITGAHHTEATRDQMSATARRLYCEGKRLSPALTISAIGKARQIAATVRYNRSRVERPLCGDSVSPRQLRRHQPGQRCLQLRGAVNQVYPAGSAEAIWIVRGYAARELRVRSVQTGDGVWDEVRPRLQPQKKRGTYSGVKAGSPQFRSSYGRMG